MAWIILPLLLLLYVVLALPHLPRRDITPLQGKDYAHRGLWNKDMPENSLPAFRNAVQHGFGVELDVHLTRDGQLVVFHDDTLKRMCGIDRPIGDFTLAELREIHLLDTAETIPSFDEVLAVMDGQEPMIVEIKPDKRLDELCEKTCARLKGYHGPYCIESFHPLAVRWFRRNAPEIIRGQLAYGVSHERHKALDFLIGSLMGNVAGRPDFIAYEAKSDRNPAMGLMRLCSPWLVAWTVRSQGDMNALRRRYDLQIFEGFSPNR